MTRNWAAAKPTIGPLIIVQVGSGHCVAGFSPHSPTRLKARGQLYYVPFWDLWGRIHFQRYLDCWRIWLSVAVEGGSYFLFGSQLGPLLNFLKLSHSLPCDPLHLQSQEWKTSLPSNASHSLNSLLPGKEGSPDYAQPLESADVGP